MRPPRPIARLGALGTLLGASLGAQAPQAAATLDSVTVAAHRWRAIGPANMGGRITDVEGIPSPSKTFYVATAGGGIWKTTNRGTTFRPIFENERCVAMGDLAIAPSDTNVIYAGTGEQNSRNSISPGCGVFKSTDGGRSWQYLGLPETEHIGRIQVHPTNPDVAWMAVVGSAWKPSRARGLYKTTDGGKSWSIVKFISEKAGFIDVQLDPRNPDVVWASSYERQRGPWFLQSGGPGSALWKSTDGGTTWAQVKGGGLPESTLGRIEIAIARSNPEIMYLMVEADTMPNAKPAKGAKAQVRPSGLYRSADGGKTWEKRNGDNVRPFYYSQVRVDPRNPDRVYWSSTPVKFSDDGGKTARNATEGIHVDHHAMWIDPNDPEHFIVGNDGGVAVTFDRGGTYDYLNIFNIGQFYNISYDMAMPYNVCGGLQDNGSWCGPSRKVRGPIGNESWIYVSGGDGFGTAQDPTDPNIVYSESQGGRIGRMDMRTGERTSLVAPTWRKTYLQYEDSILIERPDTTAPMTKAQQARIAEFRRRQKADSAENDLRWNWNTPFFLSPHNPSVFYAAGNRVVKSTKRGDDLMVISPDLSNADPEKLRISTKATGGITPDITGAETYGTIVSLAESPVRPGVLLAGTDDGNVWISRTDGATWDKLTGRFPGVPAESYVSRIEPSHADVNTFYVTFDNHRRGDFTPYVFMTSDGGATFRSIASNLPTGGPNFVHVIREDPTNPNLLFVGTDVGVWASVNKGQSWQRFMSGLPTVPVHDLKIHPRDRELIAGTHGRSIYVVDISALQQMTPATMARKVHFFEPKPALQMGQAPVPTAAGASGEGGHKRFTALSPSSGAEFAYRITESQPGKRVTITITDAAGDTVRTLNGLGTAGVHRVSWDLRGRRAAPRPLSPAERRDSIRTQQRMAAVFDSLAKEPGMDTTALRNARNMIMGGRMEELANMMGGGGGGGGGGQVGIPRFVERPGESAARPGAGAAQGEGAQAGGGMQGVMGQIFGALRDVGGGLFRPGRGGGAAPLVKPGDYLATFTYGSEVQRQVIRVERQGGLTGNSALFEEEEDEEYERKEGREP